MKNLFLLAICLIPFFSFGQMNAVKQKEKNGIKYLQLKKAKVDKKKFFIGGYGLTHKKDNTYTVAGDPNSFSVLTFHDSIPEGIIVTQGKTINVGLMGDELVMVDEIKQPFECQELVPTIPTGAKNAQAEEMVMAIPNTPPTKCVSWAMYLDYNIYSSLGEQGALDWWNNKVGPIIIALYERDSIKLTFKSVTTIKTPTYSGSSGQMLNQFSANPTSWDGDLAHLVSWTNNGGMAFVGGVSYCKYNIGQVNAQKGFSGVGAAYWDFPRYSWTVGCISHEMGHQLGSYHTHSCVWNIGTTTMGRIDTCGQLAGYEKTSICSALTGKPVGGGTIMSYCHLTDVGINLSKGFGPLPREMMWKNINDGAVCLKCAGTVTPPPPCIPRSEQRYVTCPAGQTGTWIQQRDSSCTTGLGDWYTVSNTCKLVSGDTTFKQITCYKWDTTHLRVKIVPMGATNYKYSWTRNGVKMAWTSQVIYRNENLANPNYKKGDVLSVTITSSNTRTLSYWWLPVTCTITIK